MRRVIAGVVLLASLGVALSCARPRAPSASPAASSAPPQPADDAPAAVVEPGVSAEPEPVPAPSAASAPNRPRATGVLPGYRIDPAALVGCRAPDEPGCSTCCDKSDGGCERLSGLEDWSQYPEVEPWYNSRSVNCPPSCAPCARCTERSERELAAQLPFRCDCANIQIGVDPCFSPGCECECSRRRHLVQACPVAQ